MPVANPYASLRIPDYRWYIAGLVAFTVATQIQGTVVGWQIYELTHNKLALGLIGLAEAFPFIATALYAGHVADRHDRRLVAIAALTVLLGCAAALFTLPLLLPSPNVITRAIYGVIIVSGFARSFLTPARQALAAELVPRDLYANAVTWRSGAWQLAAVAGPAIGGILYAMGGATLAYAVDTGLIFLGISALVMVRHRAAHPRAEAASIDRGFGAGIRFVFRDQVIFGALSLDLFSVFFGGATALLPVFAADILHVGPEGLGLLRSAPAIGAVVMSLALTHASEFRRTGRILLRAVAAFGLFTIGFGISTSFWLSVALLALSGAADMVSVFIRSTLLQTRTPPHLLGRVMAVNSIFVGSSNEVGMFESGVTAQWFGTVPSVVLGGLATLGVVGVIGWRLPLLRRLDRLDRSVEE